MKRFSHTISKWFLHAGAISNDEQPLYEYAIYSVLFTLIPLGFVSMISIFLNMFIEGVLMIIPFLLIRKFSGGYHLKSPVICFLSSITLLVSFFLLIRIAMQNELFTASSVIVGISATSIFLLSPIDSEKRALSLAEKLLFRKIALIITLSFTALYVTLISFSLFSYAIPIGSGVVLTALLQIPCFISRPTKNKDSSV